MNKLFISIVLSIRQLIEVKVKYFIGFLSIYDKVFEEVGSMIEVEVVLNVLRNNK